MNIESIIRRLLVKYPFFGSIIANTNFIADESKKAASTDGKNVYYNPNFIALLTQGQQICIFAHEICHIAFDHINRSKSKDDDVWNKATDAVINAFLKQDGLPLVKGMIDIKEAIYYDSEEMYNKLLNEKRQKQQQNQKAQDSSNTNNQDNSKESQNENHNVGHDDHSLWSKEIKKKHENEQLQRQTEQEKRTSEEIKKLTKLGEKAVFNQNKIERKKQLEELRKSIVSKSHGHGNNMNSERINISDIGISDPLIDWRLLLKEAVKYDVDWSYQNAEIEDGIIIAYLEEIPMPETEIVLDTSGSINKTLLRNFLRECKNILQSSKIKVGCFDERFYGFTEIKEISDIDNLKFYGGGGTDFDVAVHAFTRRVENKIIFTDGEAHMPSVKVDAIWIVFGNKKINPPGGKVIYIDEEHLKKLYHCEITNEEKGKAR